MDSLLNGTFPNYGGLTQQQQQSPLPLAESAKGRCAVLFSQFSTLIFIVTYILYLKDNSLLRLLISVILQAIIARMTPILISLDGQEEFGQQIKSVRTGLRIYIIFLFINSIGMHIAQFGFPYLSLQHSGLNHFPTKMSDVAGLCDYIGYLFEQHTKSELDSKWIHFGYFVNLVGQKNSNIFQMLFLDVILVCVQLVQMSSAEHLSLSL